MSAYETQVDIPYFSGINQIGDGYNLDLRFAVEAENVNFHNGQFRNAREGRPIAPPLPAPCGTLAFFHSEYSMAPAPVPPDVEPVDPGDDTPDPEPLLLSNSAEEEPRHMVRDPRDYLVAIAGGKVYHCELRNGVGTSWTECGSGLHSDYCSYVVYETSLLKWEEESTQYIVETDAPVDVLVFTNAIDGLQCLYGFDMAVRHGIAPQNFSVIGRSNERIWGTGATDYPDYLYYSAPYDPNDWARNNEIPEDGGGDIRAPSWDGDKFIALAPYSSQLLAFKRNAIWKIIGTNPGEYVIREQPGQGTVVPNTVVVSGGYAFMLGFTGIVRYDGNGSQEFLQDNVQKVFARVNYDRISLACAALIDRTYYLALPIDGSEINNAVLIYDSRENSFALRTHLYIKSFMTREDRLYYCSSEDPTQIYEWTEDGDALPMVWKSGIQDLGIKSSVKSAFQIYFRAESEAPFDLILGIRTEKKLKQKRVKVTPGKAHKVAINTAGRYFQLMMWSDTVVPFSINGGVKIVMELDPD